MKTVSIHTLGCKVNQVESEGIIEGFLNRGYQLVHPDEPADICIINTCTVTHVSDRKSRAVIRRAVKLQPQALVVVTGCMIQLDGSDGMMPDGVGLLVGNRNKDRLAEIVEAYLEGSLNEQDLALPTAENKPEPVLYSHIHRRTRAFVKIQDGCQSFCSYCIVPYVRGPVRSKLPEDVLSEIGQLVGLGYQEIVLTGIHCGLYGVDLEKWDLARLLAEILERIPGEYRIRLGSMEPLEVKSQLLNLMAESRQLCRHLHIPLQSGSDRILRLMRRRYQREYYRRLLLDIAGQIPDIGLAADVMVGFPSETEEDFAETYALLAELPLLDLHVFKYSPRPGTGAYQLENHITPPVKQERSDRLLNLATTKHQEFCQLFLGRELEVLAERGAGKDYYLGFTDNYLEVGFRDATDHCGKIVRVRLARVVDNRLEGDIL